MNHSLGHQQSNQFDKLWRGRVRNKQKINHEIVRKMSIDAVILLDWICSWSLWSWPLNCHWKLIKKDSIWRYHLVTDIEISSDSMKHHIRCCQLGGSTDEMFLSSWISYLDHLQSWPISKRKEKILSYLSDTGCVSQQKIVCKLLISKLDNLNLKKLCNDSKPGSILMTLQEINCL